MIRWELRNESCSKKIKTKIEKKNRRINCVFSFEWHQRISKVKEIDRKLKRCCFAAKSLMEMKKWNKIDCSPKDEKITTAKRRRKRMRNKKWKLCSFVYHHECVCFSIFLRRKPLRKQRTKRNVSWNVEIINGSEPAEKWIR